MEWVGLGYIGGSGGWVGWTRVGGWDEVGCSEAGVG